MSDNLSTTDRRALLQSALSAVEKMQAKLDDSERAKREPIAIIGMGCRFPGNVNSPEVYWELLKNGVDTIRPIPIERWDKSAAGDSDIPWFGSFLDDIDQFDPQFFGITPREASTMDPQQRLVLEVAWEALERAGIAPDTLRGSLTGVFVGTTTNDYSQLSLMIDQAELDAYTATGTASNVIPGRVAYVLGLQGPAMAVDTACSSSLVAIHLACQSLRSGESNLALTGGVNAVITPEPLIVASRWGMMAPDGRCKTFDTRADGFVRGEGCGMIVLKRLSDAQADRDPILGVILGSAVNHDGRSSGLTVPNGLSQRNVIRQALTRAGVDPADVSYVEAHGTGTSLGDPIEVEAIGQALGPGRLPDSPPLILGSVKTNIGHLEAASGVAGLMKVVLSLQHQEIPGQLHLQERSPRIPWPEFPIDIPTNLTAWPPTNGKRLAGVSSFGFSGTNAHIILGEAPAVSPAADNALRPSHILTLSAHTDDALRQLAQRYVTHLSEASDAVTDIAYTSNVGRSHLGKRLAVVAESADALQEKLSAWINGTATNAVFEGAPVAGQKPKLVFLFTGHGAQYPRMGKQLYDIFPVFRDAIDSCAVEAEKYIDRSLLSILFPQTESDMFLMEKMTYAQPALFALEYALATVWQSWGVQPTAVLGHSLGEYVAACIAGVFNLANGMRLVCTRGRLMDSLPETGEMAVVFATEEEVATTIAPYADQVTIGVINGPTSLVISGTKASIQEALTALKEKNIKTRPVAVSQAAHSPILEPILDEFESIATEVTYHSPKIALVSCMTGKFVANDEVTNASYWRRHLRQPVRFSDSMATLYQADYDTFLEIGPQPTLLSMGRNCWPPKLDSTLPARPGLWRPSLRKGSDEWQEMLESVAALYTNGVSIDWIRFSQNEDRKTPFHRVLLPTIPFQRESYWLKPQQSKRETTTQMLHPLVHEAMPSPFIQDTVYTSRLAVDAPPYLNDHRVFDLPIFPGTGYLEVMLAAARLALGVEEISLHDIQIQRAMILPESGERLVQVAVSSLQNGQATVRIFSQNEDESWQQHVSAIIKPSLPPNTKSDPLSVIAARCTQELTPPDYYRQLSEVGLEYGPTFRGIQSIRRRDGEALAQVQLPAGISSAGYLLHPALMDACLQVIGTTLPTAEDGDSGNVYVPISISHYQLLRPGTTDLICHAGLEISQGESEILRGSLQLFDPSGVLVAFAEGIQMKRVSRLDLQQLAPRPFTDLLYHIIWQPSTVSTINKDLTGHWLILADPVGTGNAVATQLQQKGGTVTIVSPANFAVLDPQAYTALVKEVAEQGNQSLRGVIHLWGLMEDENCMEASPWGYGSALLLTQALLEANLRPRLWLVTQSAIVVSEETDKVVQPAQTILWGFARTLGLEHPDLHPVILDLEIGDSAPMTAILNELTADDGENQIAWRGGNRYVARLTRYRSDTDALVISDKPFELFTPQKGVLDNISVHTKGAQSPAAGQVEIAIHAAGLNFRDVLNVLAMLPEPAGRLGNECAGVVSAVGKDVSSIKVGDAVMALAAGSFARTTLAQAEFVSPIPANLSMLEAATIPITFLTAYYGLHHLAKIQPGDRILIHAAAGGVGMAAVQLAQQAGAIIYATAGNPEKRALLHLLGVQYVMNSRSLDFAEEIMKLTKGEGVNIVLNALAGDFIEKSFSVLADKGRFLEMGKRDIWTKEQVTAFNPSLAYYPYDLADVTRDTPQLIGEMFAHLKKDFEAGTLKPLPRHVFPISRAKAAFRFMSQARHSGKIVIVPEEIMILPANATYLITGGLGGLGLAVAHGLADRGARHLVLMSRSAPSKESQTQLENLRAKGVSIVIAQADVAVTADVQRVIAQIDAEMLPLRGIIHAAGVLEDGAFSNQTWAQFEVVMRPKILGTSHLDKLTRNKPLDFFVLFSAGAALLGSRGQINYSAANAFLDGFAHYRHAHGLNALSINWGAWAEVGLAAKLSHRQQRAWAAQGIGLIQPQLGVQITERLLTQNLAQVAVLPIDWQRWQNSEAVSRNMPLLADMMKRVPVSDVEKISPRLDQETLFAANPDARLELLVSYLSEQTARVLGLSSAKLNQQQSLSIYGLDSLMAIELKNKIGGDLGINIPVTYFLEDSSIAKLAQNLLDQLGHDRENHEKDIHTESLDAEGARRLLANLDQMSEDEVSSLLNRMLTEKEES